MKQRFYYYKQLVLNIKRRSVLTQRKNQLNLLHFRENGKSDTLLRASWYACGCGGMASILRDFFSNFAQDVFFDIVIKKNIYYVTFISFLIVKIALHFVTFDSQSPLDTSTITNSMSSNELL
jgi:hypothetical protein